MSFQRGHMPLSISVSLRSNCAENIRKHILHTGKHEGVKMYNCPKCTFGSNSPMEFRNHLKDHHPDIENPDLAYLHAGKNFFPCVTMSWNSSALCPTLLFLLPTSLKFVLNLKNFVFLFFKLNPSRTFIKEYGWTLNAVWALSWLAAISCHMLELLATAIVEILWWLSSSYIRIQNKRKPNIFLKGSFSVIKKLCNYCHIDSRMSVWSCGKAFSV